MINKFVIIISFLPLIAASGCSDEPVSGSVDVASTNLEASFETPPRDMARGPSQVALRQQLRKKGWMVRPLVPEHGLGEGLLVSPTGSQHFGDQDLPLVRKIENVRLVTLYAHEDLSGYSPKSESKSTFSSEGLAHLQAMPSIREIRIRGTEIDEEGLAHLVTLPNLRKLSYGKQITDLGMMQIKQMRGLEELELYIGDDRVTPGGFESLAELDHLSTLKLIIGVPVSKKLLSPLREFPALHELHIRLADQVDQQALDPVGDIHNLHTLNVSGETIDDDSLRGIGTLDGLARLTIHSPLITSKGVAHIAGIESLKELEISYGPNVDDEALEHLQNNPNLESLAIKYTAITDQGLLHLIEQQHLLHLTLVKQKISDEGLSHLANIKSLRELHIYESDITDAGVQKLKEALPNLVVEGNWE